MCLQKMSYMYNLQTSKYLLYAVELEVIPVNSQRNVEKCGLIV